LYLFRLGYFDPAERQPFRKLNWSDVNTPNSQDLAKQAAVEGIVLLKNDGILPLKSTKETIAVIGPWANATTQMQGNYHGVAPHLVSPLQGLMNAGFQVTFSMGTNTSSNDTIDFGDSIDVAKAADMIIFAGGIDETIETEALDRLDISWPANQFALIQQLASLKKRLIVLQFGGGQVDNTWLKSNPTVRTISFINLPFSL
jgi:beta-D-xylosidase 4